MFVSRGVGSKAREEMTYTVEEVPSEFPDSEIDHQENEYASR